MINESAIIPEKVKKPKWLRVKLPVGENTLSLED